MDLNKWAEMIAQAQKKWDTDNIPLAQLQRTMASFNQAKSIANSYKPFSQVSVASKILGKPYVSNFARILGQINYAAYGKEFTALTENLKFHTFDLTGLVEEETVPKNIVVDEATRIKSIIYDIYQNNEIIYKIDSRHFEEVVAELLMLRNFKVDLTKRTRDGGYDILAIQEVGGLPVKFLVECKRYAPNRGIGIEIVRQFMDVIDVEKANAGLIVTTSYFTTGALARKEQHPYLLNLEDRLDLLGWVEKYCRKV